MKNTLLSAVSAFAIFVAGGVALAQDQSTSDTMEETTTQDMGVTEQNGSSADTTGAGDPTTDTGDGATDMDTGDTGTDMGTGTATDDPAASTEPGAATGDDADTTMPDVGDDTTTTTTETTTPTDFTQLHPYDGDPTGITVEGVPAEDVVGGTLLNQEGETLADINDLLVDSDGEPQALLVGFGGFLGLMEKTVAVGFDRVDLTANEENEYSTDLTEQEIEAMPEYEEPET